MDASDDEPGDSAGDERGDLLAELRVLQKQRILAALELLLLLLLRRQRRGCLLMLLLRMMMLRMLMSVLVLMLLVLLRHLLRIFRLGALVQHANGAVLTDPVRHLRRVDPHGELAGEQAVQHRRQQADIRAGLRNHRVHLTVDAYTTVAGAAIRPIRKPVIPVTVAQHLRQR